MTQEEFNHLYLGVFTPNQRSIALHERLEKYYKDTPDSMSNKDAMPQYRAFKLWCVERGYSQEEINRAKRNGNV